MHTMHPTLLVGPADWDAARLPWAEFEGRLAAFWRACAIVRAASDVDSPSRRITRMFLLTWEAVPAFHHDGQVQEDTFRKMNGVPK